MVKMASLLLSAHREGRRSWTVAQRSGVRSIIAAEYEGRRMFEDYGFYAMIGDQVTVVTPHNSRTARNY